VQRQAGRGSAVGAVLVPSGGRGAGGRVPAHVPAAGRPRSPRVHDQAAAGRARVLPASPHHDRGDSPQPASADRRLEVVVVDIEIISIFNY
jgi:hypothetical protein